MSTPINVTSFHPPSYPKSEETTKFLLDALADNFVFDSIDDSSKLQFVNAMQTREYNEGDWVVRQGDVGDYFYVVGEGQVAFLVGEESPDGVPNDPPHQVGTGAKGSTFGELALLYNTPRNASVRAVTPLKTFRIDRLTFRSLLTAQRNQARSDILESAKKISIFQGLDEARLGKLVDAFFVMTYQPGERIFNKGDRGDVLYFVKSGKVKIEASRATRSMLFSNYRDFIIEEGECFGEYALITGEARLANATALTQSTVMCVSKGVLEELLGPLDKAVMHCYLAKALRLIPTFRWLGHGEVDRCVKYLKEESFNKGDKIIPSGKFYFIKQGRALMMSNVAGSSERKLSNEPKLTKLEKNGYFEDLLGSCRENGVAIQPPADSMNLMNENTIYVEEDMVCLTLRSSDFESVVGDLKGFFERSLDASEDGIRVRKKRSSIDLSKLKMHRILGRGAFGKVCVRDTVSVD
jgi:cAMP-dependent protein kinase regulator